MVARFKDESPNLVKLASLYIPIYFSISFSTFLLPNGLVPPLLKLYCCQFLTFTLTHVKNTLILSLSLLLFECLLIFFAGITISMVTVQNSIRLEIFWCNVQMYVHIFFYIKNWFISNNLYNEFSIFVINTNIY